MNAPQEKVIVLASVFVGLGILLMLSAFLRIRLPSGKLQESIEGISLSLRGRRAKKTPFADLGNWLALVLPGRERVERLLLTADYPHPYTSVEDFYAQKVMTALMAAGGSLVILSLGAVVARLPLSVPVVGAVLMGAVGFLLPDLAVRRQGKRRQEAATTEMAFLLDRLAMYVAAGHTLPMAITQVARRPGGVLTEELRRVATGYDVSGDIVKPLEEMAKRLDMPQMYILASQIAMVVREGGEILPALRSLAQEARNHLSETLTERAERNALVRTMIVAGFILPATTLIIVAPSAALLLKVL